MAWETAAEALPEEGRLVEIRGQNWVVSRVHVAPRAAGSPSTLVELQSVADGRYGEKLSVIWEVEPGRRVLPAGSLPDVTRGGFDSPDRLAAFLDAVRWSAVASADVRTLQAPFRSGVAVEPYQLEPVARAIGAPRVNLLLADDVGLGKTVEAGLVAQELLLRGRADRIMVVAPAGLTLKWRDELAEKFGLDFQIVDSAACAQLRRTVGTAANPFRTYPRTIVSLPWLRGAKAQRLLDEVIPEKPDEERTGPDDRFFDLLILDEAHHVAPAAPKQLYAVDSQQTRLIRRLAPHFAHRLFLSATPHNGYFESYTALLEIIDDQRFVRGVQPDDRTERETVVRRLKREIKDAEGARFRQREAVSMTVEYTAAEREVHALLARFAALRAKSLDHVGKHGRRAADLVTLLLKKRLFSSPAAFLHTVRVYLARIDESSGGAGRAGSGDTADWFDDFADSLEGLDDEAVREEEDAALGRATRLAPVSDPEAVEVLRALERWAVTHEATADSKARRLISELRAVCRPDGELWSNDRIVVFTEYRDTQRWLHDLLEQEGLAEPGRIAELHGGISKEEREEVRLGFQARPDSPEGKVRILLATDAAGEGIDLQKYCHQLVNYDIPFNPNKLEQRIGRIDRWGQKHSPRIIHFVGSAWNEVSTDPYEGDLEFLSRMAQKVARVEADLGSVNPVLAEAVQRRMTGDLTADLDGGPASRGDRKPGTRMATQPGVSDQVARLAAQYDQSVSELGLTPENIHRVVATALELDGQQPLRPVSATSPEADTLFSDMEDDPDGPDLTGSLFEVPPLTGSWERATRGLTHALRPDRRRPVTFDSRIAAASRDDVVLAHLAHPLVDMSTRLLTAAVWKPDTVGLHRVAAVVSERPELETTLVGAYARFVLVGNDGVRLHEEILHAGGWVGENGWIRRWQNVTTQREVLQHALTHGDQAAPHLRESLAARWPQVQERLTNSLHARRNERLEAMTSQLATRASEERERINAAFDRFDATLRAKLREEGSAAGEQTALFGERELTSLEARQYREDRERWEARRESLGADRARELAAVSARYRDPQPYLFPVAVVFAVPAKEASQ
ncbi:DISARM system SNF2-like helicase DrmD [Streptomyces xiaopingdaonensis]|uniref:DISARM system SNF2-like helicase DrmD n=1 Tax=Streptomyces xiaopingdaonensis TaxID=1565415 RepID=UPI0002EBAD6B|nr:DISARM system SNF2-like helicase DrmD [Streptomyces xiaopingdaonensis]